MIRATVEWKENGPIEKAASALDDAVSVDYEINRWFRNRIDQIVKESNDRKLSQSIDKDGKPLAPLAASTLKRRRGPGGPLDPPRSSFRLRFKTRWDTNAAGRWIFVAWYDFPHAVYHATGTKTLPRRDLMGLDPQGKREVQAALDEYRRRVARSLSIGGRLGGLAKSIFRR